MMHAETIDPPARPVCLRQARPHKGTPLLAENSCSARCCDVVAALSLTAFSISAAQTIQPTGPQQLSFAQLLASSNPSQPRAQINAVRIDAQGNIYLLLDQKDGVRLLKTDPTASTVLAQTQIGAPGDIGLALALDPAGERYLTLPEPPRPAQCL